jgi:hypothetical protein
MRRLIRHAALAVVASAALLSPSGASAAVMTIGSPLAAPATYNTAENLNYRGTDTSLPPGPELPNGGLVHTYHFGADTAIWNTALTSGTPGAPSAGQAVQVKLEGCAEQAQGGPSPLNQIHLQDITPLPDGSAKVDLTSQPFEIPVCGQNGASGSTITTYNPINLCMSQGDYIDFNDEGGFVEHYYRSGVPYRVLGPSQGSSADSFIKGGGTNNGDTMSSGERSNMEGFAVNQGTELMLQVEFATGPDATHICAGGSKGVPPPLPAMRISGQKDGVNHSRVTRVAVYCRQKPQCTGTATLAYKGKTVGETAFAVNANTTSHVQIRLAGSLVKRLRKTRDAQLVLTVNAQGTTFTQTITVGIF